MSDNLLGLIKNDPIHAIKTIDIYVFNQIRGLNKNEILFVADCFNEFFYQQRVALQILSSQNSFQPYTGFLLNKSNNEVLPLTLDITATNFSLREYFDYENLIQATTFLQMLNESLTLKFINKSRFSLCEQKNIFTQEYRDFANRQSHYAITEQDNYALMNYELFNAFRHLKFEITIDDRAIGLEGNKDTTLSLNDFIATRSDHILETNRQLLNLTNRLQNAGNNMLLWSSS